MVTGAGGSLGAPAYGLCRCGGVLFDRAADDRDLRMRRGGKAGEAHQLEYRAETYECLRGRSMKGILTGSWTE